MPPNNTENTTVPPPHIQPPPKKWPFIVGGLLLILIAAVLFILTHPAAPTADTEIVGSFPVATTTIDTGFSSNQPVIIQGYSGDAEEPYLSPDGQYLVFDNRGLAPDPNLYYAKKINDTTFTYVGEVKGVNSPMPETAPSMDDAGNFYFNSFKNAPKDTNLIYRGHWQDGTVSDVAHVSGLPTPKPGVQRLIINVSPDGNTLYLMYCDPRGAPKYCDVGIALKNPDGSFTELDDGSTDSRMTTFQGAFKNIYGMYYGGNPTGIHFSGPSVLSPDGLEAYFEQINVATGTNPPQLNRIYVAKRSSTSEPFDTPQELAGQAPGFNEGAFLSRDGKRLYYHHFTFPTDGNPPRFSLYVMTRQ